MSWLNQPYQGSYPGQPPQQQQQQQQQQGQYPLQPQQTGYPLQPQQTGFQPQLQPQPQQQQQPQYQQQQQNYGGGGLRPALPLQSQQTGYIQQPMNSGGYNSPQRTGYAPQQQQQQPTYQQQQQIPMPSPLISNPTGYGVGGGGLGQNQFGGGVQRQFISTFMPSNNIQPTPYMNPSEIQFAQQPLQGPTLEQSFITQNQQQSGSNSVPIPWALTVDEKKRYDQIFRAWDQQGNGFIPGGMAKEVFGQAGLERDDLMAIWNLSDVEDRGKLNIDEFHVAMGLIYRRLNGNPIPTTLPPELAPPSARDLTDSVGFLTRLLKSDTNTRSTNSSPDQPGSYAKSRSLADGGAVEKGRKDATVYRHDDSGTKTYKSSSRHLDRDTVRFGNDEDGTGGTNSDLEEVKKGLSKGQALLNRAEERDEEEQDLKDELRDLKRRIERVNDDLEYNLRGGRRTEAKDVEKRKLMRELSTLEHQELPELIKRMEEKDREKRIDKKKLALERDSRSDKYDKYQDRTSASSRRNYDDDEDDRPRGYQRGTFEQDDDRRDYTRSSSSRNSSPPRSSRTPPPPPPPAPVASKPIPPPAPTPPVVSATPPPIDTKSMTEVDRKAYIQAEAQRRIQLRLRALGVTSPSDSSPLDTSVADRLESDRLEAKRRADLADEDLRVKELARQTKLQQEKLRGVEIEQEISKKDLGKVDVVRKEVEQSGLGGAAEKAAKAQLEKEEQALIEQEAALAREKEERMERVRKLERELEEAKEAEENFVKNKAKFASGGHSKVPPPPPTSRGTRAPPAPVSTRNNDDDDDFTPTPRAASPPPPPPVAPVAPTPPTTSRTNPFTRLTTAAASPVVSPAATTVVKPNPFLPAAIPKAISRPPPTDDDWDSPAGLEKNNDSDDSSDEEDMGNRNTRQNLAQNLFSMMGISGPSRPESTSSTPPPPPPPPPSAPPAPVAPSAPSAPMPTGPPNPSALLGQIQGGLRLKATKTKDRSTPSSAGAVIGDASAPVQVYVAPPSPPPAPPAPKREEEEIVEEVPEEEEVPTTLPAIVSDPMDDVDLSIRNRSRSVYAYEGQRPEDLSFEENVVIIVNPPKDRDSPWAFGTIEKSGKSGWIPKSYVEEFTVHKIKALYAYAATSAEELSFEENELVSIVDSSDPSWWKAEVDGIIGLVPGTYFEDPKTVTVAAAKERPLSLAISIPETPPTSIKHLDRTLVDNNSDSDSSDSEDEYGTATPESQSQLPKEREAERLRVLEAAGLLVRGSPVGRSPKRRSTMRRVAPSRPPPPLPQLGEEVIEIIEEPVEIEEQEERMEDAYDLYQRVMRDLPSIPSQEPLDLTLSYPSTSDLRPSTPPPLVALPPSTEPRLSLTGSFLSRVSDLVRTSSGTSTPIQERIKPAISGPIAGERGSFVQTLGSSWASLIDPSALENVSDPERKRQESIFELIGTEQHYVETLQLLIEVFFSALQPVLAEKASEIVFANVDDILMFNTLFLSALEDRQKSSRLYVDSIGDIIRSNVRGLEVYRGYCVNQGNARRVLADLKATDPTLRKLLEKLRVKNLELEHFLLEPMQRLTRYPLLISQILRYTTEDSSDHEALSSSLVIVEEILGAVNAAVRTHDDEEKLIRLSDNLEFVGVDHRLDLTAPTRFLGPRTILKEGVLLKAKSGRKLNAYLFNDLLLLTEFKSPPSLSQSRPSSAVVEIVYKWPIPLEECSIKEQQSLGGGLGGEEGLTFSVQHRGGSIGFKASSARNCRDWKQVIGEARRVALDGMQKSRGGSVKSRGGR